MQIIDVNNMDIEMEALCEGDAYQYLATSGNYIALYKKESNQTVILSLSTNKLIGKLEGKVGFFFGHQDTIICDNKAFK